VIVGVALLLAVCVPKGISSHSPAIYEGSGALGLMAIILLIFGIPLAFLSSKLARSSEVSRLGYPVTVTYLIASTVFLAIYLVPKSLPILAYTPPPRTCLTDMRQLSTGLALYFDANDDRTPLAATWIDGMLPFLKTDVDASCDALPNANKGGVYGHAFHREVAGRARTDFVCSDNVIVFFDSVNLERNAAGTLQDLPKKPRNELGHGVAFLDGHAGFLRKR
jgi:hypothetical protein